jgi:hypothetical protein
MKLMFKEHEAQWSRVLYKPCTPYAERESESQLALTSQFTHNNWQRLFTGTPATEPFITSATGSMNRCLLRLRVKSAAMKYKGVTDGCHGSNPSLAQLAASYIVLACSLYISKVCSYARQHALCRRSPCIASQCAYKFKICCKRQESPIRSG